MKVRLGVVRTSDGLLVGTTKSGDGARNVASPHYLLAVVDEHLLHQTAPGRDSLLFDSAYGENSRPSSFYGKNPEESRTVGGRFTS